MPEQGSIVAGAATAARPVGLGRTGKPYVLSNYLRIITDSFYLESLWITVKVSALVTIGTLCLAYPVDYAGVVASTFITIVIKVFGLVTIFAGNGWLNRG